MNKHGHFHWNELMTRDAEKAKSFYSETLGWTFEAFPMAAEGPPYWVCMQGEDPVGGLFTMDGPHFENVPEHWMGYIAVDNVDARVEKAEAAGAAILRPPFEVEKVGRIAILKEPGGAVIGWITPAQQG